MNEEDAQNSKLSYDSDDELFLTAVIKCEEKHIEEVTVDQEDVYSDNDEGPEEGEEIWGCDNTFLQICEKVDNQVTVKQEDEDGVHNDSTDEEGEGIWGCDDTFRQIEDEVTVKQDVVQNNETGEEEEEIWDSDDSFVQICDEVENVRTNSHPKSLLCNTTLADNGSSLDDNSPINQTAENRLLIQQGEMGSQNDKCSQKPTSSTLIASNQDNIITYNQPEETTDMDERSTHKNIIPEPPKKLKQQKVREINYEKLIRHKITTIQNEPNDGYGYSCPSDCSDCLTESEVRMGFNMRDVVLMTTSSEDESSTKNVLSPRNQATDDRRDKEVAQSDSSDIKKTIKKSIGHTRKQKKTTHRKRRIVLSESSESDFSNENRNQAKTRVKRSVPNKKMKLENQRKRQKLSNNRRRNCSSSSDFIKDTSSESDYSSSSNNEARPKNRKILRNKVPRCCKSKYKRDQSVEESGSCDEPLTLSSLEKLVEESSPKLKVVLEDIGPKLVFNNGVKKASNKGDTDTKDSDELGIISADEISDSEIQTYTRSRPVKPGPKYRYRRQHTGDTDEENEDSSVSSKGEIEFENDTDSETSSAGTCSAVPSEDISDPDEDDEIEAANGKCIVCRALGSTNVEGRSRVTNTYWCKCDHCAISSRMMRDYDRVCCQELTNVVEFLNDELDTSSQENFCITMHPRFKKDVLGFGAYLRTQKNAYFCCRTATEQKRVYYAMLSFIRWIFDRMLDGDRIMPPACVVKAIREAHMENPNEPRYITFKPVKYCDTGFHCKAAMGIKTSASTG